MSESVSESAAQLFLVERHTILSVVVGSRAFGLSTAASDTDRRGVYVAPTADFWRMTKPPTHVEGPLPEQFSWEVERFCELALNGNPNILEVLHSPLVEQRSELGAELQDLAPAFLSRRVYATFARYAASQFTKAENRRELEGEPRWKHIMHMLRLMISGAVLLEDGTVRIDAGPYRERLLAVRRGELSWDEVRAWREDLAVRLDRALTTSPLPEHPDADRVENWLISVRRRSLTNGSSLL
ncbi:DNA polymerase beta superfamily protein [Streptomyces sp. UNOC14_S4]|uniref:nucleotidyltransferase domain-containing protein n=1 Tax=Streptomyces sp. UNOC14_S4 TaxID=2872340 RepID=UPI001E5E5B0B|nr:nucleotidyltransferase domain-containing protein [Streptomyces sp. UNOC14_S4]MCC3770544.1 nucleotidyltransferase domain-containing protein [Streptomyces sp. UNOC14_S4]